MTSKQVAIRTLEAVLKEIGFQPMPSTGYHRVWKHEASGTEILLPGGDADQPASLADVVGVRTILVKRGLLAPEEWELRLEQIASASISDPLLPRFSVGEQVRLTDAPDVFTITGVHITATGTTYDLAPLGRSTTGTKVQNERQLVPVSS